MEKIKLYKNLNIKIYIILYLFFIFNNNIILN